MSPTVKRILLIIGLILATILIGFALYLAFRASTGQPLPFFGQQTTETTTGKLPFAGQKTPGTGEVSQTTPGTLPTSQPTLNVIGPSYYQPKEVETLTRDYAVYPSLASGGNLRYHNAADGKFYKINPDGTIKALSDQTFYNVSNVTWAKTADKAVLEYPDGAKIVYDFDKQKQVTLPSHWEGFTFSPDSSEIAAKSIGLSPENRWLITTKDDGTDTKLIEPLGENGDKVTMDWSPSRQTVAFSQTGAPQGADRKEILFVGLNGENFKSIIAEGLDFEPQWSNTGKKLLYSVDSARSDFKPELWIADAYGDSIGSNRQMIKLNTWAHKCSFGDDTTLFCAVPRDLPTGAGMSPEIASGNYDDLYKIDLKTGSKVSIPLGGNDYTIENISYDKIKNRVIFTDNHQTGIFEAKL